MHSWPQAIATGADGALWFTDPHANMIGRVTVDGQFSSWQAGDLGIGLVLGPNGALWFTTDASDANAIGSITTGGGISYYAVDSSPWGIAVGPSGNDLWFPMYSTNQIGRLSTTGRTTAFDVPHRGPRDGPMGIATGPDNALWFTEPNGNHIGRISASA